MPATLAFAILTLEDFGQIVVLLLFLPTCRDSPVQEGEQVEDTQKWYDVEIDLVD